MDSRLLFSCLKDSEIVKEDCRSLHKLFRVLKWSFEALASGVYPSIDEEGAPFTPQHHPRRAALAGLPLTSAGHRGAWVEMRGDWEFLRDALLLQKHYLRNEVCHLCRAEKRRPGFLFTDFRRRGDLRRTLVSSAAWLAAAMVAAVVSPLVLIPGFCIWRCYFDIMHTLDLGVYQHAVPAALQELILEPATVGPGGDAAAAPAPVGAGAAPAPVGVFPGATLEERLRSATRAYREWCRQNKIPSVVRRITTAWVTGAWPHISQQHAKAAALRSMVYWVREVCAATVGHSPHAGLRAALFDSFVKADCAMRRSGRFLDTDARAEVAQHVEDALTLYNALATSAAAAGHARWRLIPKLHALTHIAYDNEGVNPRAVHCYQDEDMVGRVKRVYMRCHGSTAPQRALERYVLHTALSWWLRLQVLRGLV